MFDNFYGLSAKPFQLTPDPAFYSGAHPRKALSYPVRPGTGEGFIAHRRVGAASRRW